MTRDYRGLAMTTTVTGKVQAPFVDKDGDGLADVDAMGHFVDATGNRSPCRRRSPSSARPTRRRATRRAARSPRGRGDDALQVHRSRRHRFGGLAREA